MGSTSLDSCSFDVTQFPEIVSQSFRHLPTYYLQTVSVPSFSSGEAGYLQSTKQRRATVKDGFLFLITQETPPFQNIND
jgi:hypothetical protein